MSTEKTDAIVIRQADFSESSRVVTLFSREFGQISTVAKGVRRLKGPFEAAIDLLAVCRIVFIRKSTTSLDILTEAQLISRFTPHEKNLSSLYGGYYLAELLSSLTEEYDPHPLLFDEAVTTLGRHSGQPDWKLSLLRFELIVLREIGQLPAFDECVACGTPVTNEDSFGFWVSQGGLICSKCQNETYQQNQIQPGSITLLQKLTTEPAEIIDRLVVSSQQYKEMRHVVTAAISHVLGRRPKMLRYLKD